MFKRFDLLSFVIVTVQTVQLLGSFGNCLLLFNFSEQALLDFLYPVKCPTNDGFRQDSIHQKMNSRRVQAVLKLNEGKIHSNNPNVIQFTFKSLIALPIWPLCLVNFLSNKTRQACSL